MTIAERDARKRLLIDRHIAKMTPEEIGRRFTVYVLAVVRKAAAKTTAPPLGARP